MSNNIKIPKKLIEVALPLDDINVACSREKQPGIGVHPRGLHLWWARRPLAAARAVLFAQMVNDPGGERGWTNTKTKIQAAKEREELFDILRDLMEWKNINDEVVINRAREAIRNSWIETCELNKGKPEFDPEKLPAFHDPFAGGGAIPLEAQRLGLKSYASDLNPVAVMINKAMIEIPPKFAGQKPIGPLPTGASQIDLIDDCKGAQGLAEDVRRYGHWMRDKAFEQIGHFYPKVKITSNVAANRKDLKDYVGKELTVIAWLWARTVKSPNPAFNHLDVPLVRSFVLCSKKGKEVWVEPVFNENGYVFKVRIGKQPSDAIKGTVVRAGGTCLLSQTAMPFKYIRDEGQAGRMGQKLMAIVVDGKRGRVYLSPNQDTHQQGGKIKPIWKPEIPMHGKCRVNVSNYGLDVYGDLFTSRQLVALTTFSDLIQEARNKVISDARERGMLDDGIGIDAGGIGATAYGDALALYLSFAIDRLADYNSAIASWKPSGEQVMQTYKRQAIPMTWDFPESNILGEKSICWSNAIKYTADNLAFSSQLNCLTAGKSLMQDAACQSLSKNKIISTDPPYYDNIAYADLSDFFYVWMRRSLQNIFPKVFSTIAVPKAEELVATPYRHGSKDAAERFFINGMTKAIQNMAKKGHPAFPVSIYYAFKQSETKSDGTSSAGWETFLEAVITAGFAIVGTWPMRTELSNRMIASGANALASSVVLVCKKRKINAESISRRKFQKELREKMPEALEAMLGGNEGISPIAPVDLSQAAIGPGMAIFSACEAVLNQDGSKMSVHDALILINRAITEYLNPDSGNFDADTLFCDDWFGQYGWGEGQFGEANVLAQAKGTTVDGVVDAGVLVSGGGKVRLLKWSEYPSDWDPKTDKRTPIWEACHQIIRVLNQQSETQAGTLLAMMPERGEAIRQLAYHLYTQCERKKWAEEARAYNELIGSWHAIVSASQDVDVHDEQQREFDF
jgi:putative DNA methylase